MHQSKPEYLCLIYDINMIYFRNFCYILYLESHEPIKSATFEVYWKDLTKQESKHWMKIIVSPRKHATTKLKHSSSSWVFNLINSFLD